MTWIVQFHDAFESDFDQLPETVQDGLLAHAGLLEQLGYFCPFPRKGKN